jgi:hypothetical protein
VTIARALSALAGVFLFGAVDLPPQSATGMHEHTVSGRVLRPAPGGLSEVRGQWVVLHRLGSDSAGPLDSTRTDGRGAYRFRFVPMGDEDALYFAAASHGGVAYFTMPFRDHAVAGEAADIVVYDTTTRDIPISVRGRHLVFSAPNPDSRRVVMEIFELSNDTMVTRVSPLPDSPPTWRATLPATALEPRVSSGDIPAEAVHFEGGEIRVVAPFPPGVRQLAFSYSLPIGEFPLSVPVAIDTDMLEVLIEEPAGIARGAQLAEVDAATVDGRNFRRFVAQDVRTGAVAVIDIPRASSRLDPRYIAGLTLLIGGTMLFVLARTLRSG